MKKYILLPILFLLAFVNINAQEFTGSLLWKISGNGLQKPSYIMGTHHLAPITFLDSIVHLKEKLNEAEQIVGEIVIEDMLVLQQRIVQFMPLPDNVSYRDILSEEEYNELDTLLINHLGSGLDKEFGRMKPAVLSMIYATSTFSKTMETDMTNHIASDIYFQQIGLEQNKEIVGLETIEDQLHTLFQATPLKQQALNLLCALKNEDSSIDESKQLTQLYYNQDLAGLEELVNRTDELCQTSEEEYYRLNKERNDKWLIKLPQLMADHSSFIAVGCLHLVGKDGLLYNLHHMGYTVTAIR